jgi:general stress protein YciG
MTKVKSKGRGQGFASLSKERQKEIASAGGKAAHANGKAHTWTHDEAVAAGKKGGANKHKKV